MKPHCMPLALVLAALFAAPAPAADHRDGPLTTNDPTADINDVYAFVDPTDTSRTVIAVTAVPLATSNSRFSDVVEYHVHIDNGGAGNATTTITCTFPQEATRVLCRGAGDTLYAEGPLGQTIDADDLKIWAGLRDDPFYFDLDAFNRTRAALAPRFTNPGVNFFAGANTLAIVMSIESARLTNNGANRTLKVYAATTRNCDAGIGAGISGLWYDPANPGHGLVLQVSGSGDEDNRPYKMVAYWNVFTPQGAQLNLWGIGDVENNGDQASVPVNTSTGGNFPPALSGNASVQPFGTLDFTFSDCSTASMAVTTTRAGYANTTVPLKRLTSVLDLPCSFNSTGQIDRMGRPGINTALIDLLASTGKKDAYNRAEDPAGWAAAFQSEMQANLAALDTLDGTSGNAVLPAAALAGVLVDDRLQINTAIPACDAYLAVELGIATNCGGRTLARDVIDDTLGAVVGPGVSDNVSSDSTFLAAFPFLGTPN
jgi:Domain of unknown function (DUF4331)